MKQPALAPRETLVVSEATSRSMRSNRSKDTGPELAFRHALTAAGLRGYRKHVVDLPGTPDIVFRRKRLAVFVHGCYWHRCPKCRKDAPLKTNEAFWLSKLESNVTRDLDNTRRLEALGFRVVVIWECDIKRSLDASVKRIYEEIFKVELRTKNVDI